MRGGAGRAMFTAMPFHLRAAQVYVAAGAMVGVWIGSVATMETERSLKDYFEKNGHVKKSYSFSFPPNQSN